MILVIAACGENAPAVPEPPPAEVVAMFAEISMREEQYRVENGEYVGVVKCKTDPCHDQWSALGVKLPVPKLTCGYSVVSGIGKPSIPLPALFEFIPPAGAWYYITANCGQRWFYTTSTDPRIQQR